MGEARVVSLDSLRRAVVAMLFDIASLIVDATLSVVGPAPLVEDLVVALTDSGAPGLDASVLGADLHWWTL